MATKSQIDAASVVYIKAYESLNEPWRIDIKTIGEMIDAAIGIDSNDNAGGVGGEVVSAAWKLVPVEPTNAMLMRAQTKRAAQGFDPFGAQLLREAYDAMLAAAPTPPDSPPLIDAVVKALRKLAIVERHRPLYNGGSDHIGWWCKSCDSDWKLNEPEKHSPGCCADLSAFEGKGAISKVETSLYEREVIEHMRGDLNACRKIMASDADVVLRVLDRLTAATSPTLAEQGNGGGS